MLRHGYLRLALHWHEVKEVHLTFEAIQQSADIYSIISRAFGLFKTRIESQILSFTMLMVRARDFHPFTSH